MSSSTPISPAAVVAEHQFDALDELAPLWGELLAHHVACAPHLGDLAQVRSAAESWQIRRAEYQAWLAEPDATVLTVRERGRLLGYAFVRIIPAAGSWKLGDRVGVLETLVVAAKARGRGLGRRLLQAVDGHCQTRGATTLRISVIDGNDASSFYIHHGAVPFTDTLLLPLPVRGTAVPAPRSAAAGSGSGSWQVVEHVTVPKTAAGANEDELLLTDDLVTVIDGATDKSGRDYGGLTGGARAAQCVRDTLARMAPDTSPE